MKQIVNLIITVLVCCLSSNLFSQNLFRLIRPVARKSFSVHTMPATIQRVTVVETRNIERAVRVATLQSMRRQQLELHQTAMKAYPNIDVSYMVQDINQLKCRPEQIYGGYNYLKVCTNAMKGKEWEGINKNNSYNGVHHLITVQTLKVLHKESLLAYEEGKISLFPFFNEMVANAPGLFHQLHNNPAYRNIFHNSKVQLELYDTGGIKAILDDFFINIRKIQIDNRFEQIPEDVIKGTYLEAELWSEHFGLVWEK